MTTEASNHAKFQMASGNIDFDADSFKIILMATGFTFNKDTHATYTDVSASELSTGNGYTQNTKTLTGVSVTEDDANDRAEVTWSNAQWTASGGSIGPSPGAIIFDDTSGDDTVIGYIDFGEDKTASDGSTFTINSITVRLT
jgi:hypothetical protein